MALENEIKFFTFIGSIFTTTFFYILVIFPFSSIILVWNKHAWVTNLILTELILLVSSFLSACLCLKIKEILEKEIQNAN